MDQLNCICEIKVQLPKIKGRSRTQVNNNHITCFETTSFLQPASKPWPPHPITNSDTGPLHHFSGQYPPRPDRIFIFPPSCAPHQLFINVHFLGRRRRIMKDGRGAVAAAAGENGCMDDEIWSIGTASSISWHHHSSADQRFMTSNSSTTSNLITHFCTFPPVSCLNYNFMPSKEASFLPSEYFLAKRKRAQHKKLWRRTRWVVAVDGQRTRERSGLLDTKCGWLTKNVYKSTSSSDRQE